MVGAEEMTVLFVVCARYAGEGYELVFIVVCEPSIAVLFDEKASSIVDVIIDVWRGAAVRMSLPRQIR